jgi:hypothetical protein
MHRQPQSGKPQSYPKQLKTAKPGAGAFVSQSEEKDVEEDGAEI